MAEGQLYATSDEFRAKDIIYYNIAKDKKLLKYIYPDESTVPVYAETTPETEFLSTSMESSLENLINIYQNIPYTKGEHRKLSLTKVIRDLQEILKKEY